MSYLQNRLDDARIIADALSAHEHLPLPDLSGIQLSTSEDNAEIGDIEFEWYLDGGNLITIWCRHHHVSYAGILDGNSFCGRSEMLEVIPAEALENIFILAERIKERTRGKYYDMQGKLHTGS